MLLIKIIIIIIIIISNLENNIFFFFFFFFWKKILKFLLKIKAILGNNKNILEKKILIIKNLINKESLNN